MMTGTQALDVEKAQVDQSRKVARLLDMQSAMSPAKASDDAEETGQSSGNSKGAVTLEAIEGLLDKKCAPMNSSINEIQSQMSGLKVKVKHDIDQVKSKLSKVEDVMKLQGIRLKEMENKFEADAIPPFSDPQLKQKIEDIEVELGKLKMVACVPKEGPSTALVGAMNDASSGDSAKTWLWGILQKEGIEGVQDVYYKGDFKGLLWVKFASIEKREVAISKYNSLKSKYNNSEKNSYMNPDLPITIRAGISFLNSLKKLMVSWGQNAGSIKWDPDLLTMQISGKDVLRVASDDYKFVLTWVDPSWGKWEELVNDPQFKNLAKEAQDKLTKAQTHIDKGKGKGGSSATSA
jgi:hypothetical protein